MKNSNLLCKAEQRARDNDLPWKARKLNNFPVKEQKTGNRGNINTSEISWRIQNSRHFHPIGMQRCQGNARVGSVATGEMQAQRGRFSAGIRSAVVEQWQTLTLTRMLARHCLTKLVPTSVHSFLGIMWTSDSVSVLLAWTSPDSSSQARTRSIWRSDSTPLSLLRLQIWSLLSL